MGQQVVLTPQAIEQIRQQTKQEWRKCKRKQYNIFACKMPAGYIFANKLEQPNSYNAIKQVFHKDIVHSSEFKNNPQLVEFLKANGFYQTDGTRIVLCGTKGELWDVKPEKFVQSYRAITGGQITSMEDGIWIEVTRAPEMKANAVGIQLPKKYLGVYKTSWATLYVNNPNSSGHGKGDILVAPMLPNGQPDYAHISPTNNEVFALTYDQNVGSWGNSGLIINANNIKRLTLSEVRSMYKVASSESNYDNIVNLAVNACKGFVMQTIKEDNGVDMIFRNKNKNILKDCSNMNIVQYIDERLKQLNFTFIEKKIGKNGKVYFEGECTYKRNNISFQIIPEYNDGNNVLGTIKCSYKWHNYFPSDFKNIEEFENALNGCEKFLKENGISFKKLQNSKPILS